MKTPKRKWFYEGLEKANQILEKIYPVKQCDFQIIQGGYCIEYWSCWKNEKQFDISEKVLVRVVRHGNNSSLFINRIGENIAAALVKDLIVS